MKQQTNKFIERRKRLQNWINKFFITNENGFPVEIKEEEIKSFLIVDSQEQNRISEEEKKKIIQEVLDVGNFVTNKKEELEVAIAFLTHYDIPYETKKHVDWKFAVYIEEK